MAGSLIKIDEEIVTSAVASVDLGGSNWDSSYDVYMVRLNNIIPSSDIQFLYWRVTVSGTPDTSANYDRATKLLRADTTFTNANGTNDTKGYTEITQLGNATGESLNGIMYLFNFNNSSEYSFVTQEISILQYSGVLMGSQGGAVHTVAQSCDGIQFAIQTGNIASGTFTLYGLKK